MSFFTLAFVGIAPFGSLLGGILAHRVGVPATLFLMGAASFLTAFLFRRQLPFLRMLVRPIYLQKGILERIPE